MNIMHVISSAASGGAEVYVKDLSKQMVELGHDVFVVMLDRACETGRDAEFEAAFLAELADNGIQYGFLGRDCRRNALKGVVRLARFCRGFMPDIIHSHLYYGAIFSLFQFGTRHVYTHHNIKIKAPKALYHILDFRTKCYVGICKACYDLLRDVTKNPVVRIDNGVDRARVNVKNSYTAASPIKLICVGSLSEQKNHELLLNAIARNADLEISLDIVGEGVKRERLMEAANSLGLAGRVNFVGNSTEVNRLLHEADVFVMSSAWEGLPIAQIEATLTGLPVLVTNVGGCAEIVDSVGNGLVAKVDLDDYSDKLREMVSNEEFRTACHQNALLNSGHYTIDTAAIRHMAMYEKVLQI